MNQRLLRPKQSGRHEIVDIQNSDLTSSFGP
jgi:hypothetical protein